MSGFIVDGQPYEAPERGAQDAYAQTPPASGGFGAMFSESSPLEWLTRARERGAAQDASVLDRTLAQAVTQGDMDPGIAGFAPPLPEAPKEMLLSAEEANRLFAPPGEQITNAPISPMLAHIIGDQRRAQIERESILSRYENEHSWPVNFATGTAAFMMDPLNAATTFLPGIGEEAVTARLGTSLAARVAARTVAGASVGAVAQAPLSALRMGLSSEEGGDYGWRAALRDVMFSAAGNAALHAGFLGGLREAGVLRPDEPMRAAEFVPGLPADAASKAAAMQAGIGEMAEEAPVDVGAVVNQPAPAPAPGTLRVYHGGNADPTTGGSRWVTTDPAYARDFRSGGEAKQVWYVDVPLGHPSEEGARQWDALDEQNGTNAVGQYANFEVPEDIAKGFREYHFPGSDPATTAAAQQAQQANGFSQGIPDAEFRAASDQLYGEREEAPATKPTTPAGEADPQLAAAEQQVTAMYARMTPEDRAAWDASATAMDQANIHETAYTEAAACLSGAAETIPDA